MQHFFVSPEQVREEKIYVEGSDVNHMKNVLRMKTGEELTIGDGDGWLYVCVVESYEEDMAVLKILEKKKDERQTSVQKSICFGTPKTGQDGTDRAESGGTGCIPGDSGGNEACSSKVGCKESKKEGRTLAADRSQCGKAGRKRHYPGSRRSVYLCTGPEVCRGTGCCLIPYELAEGMEETKQIIAEIRPGQSVGIFIGPEGGFEKEEVEQAVKAGAEPLTLGKRILRTETAGLTMLSVLMFHLEG